MSRPGFESLYNGPDAAPTLYVASTGSDASTQPGTALLPLLTVQEAIDRLEASGYTTEAFIEIQDALNLGANPTWRIGAIKVAGAKPIAIKCTTSKAIAAIACTGGTNANLSTCAAAVFTSANAVGANTQRGRILAVTAGANLAGMRGIIDTNDGAGGFSVPEYLANAPIAGNTFDILQRVGSVTWTGMFTVYVTHAAFIDSMKFLPTGASSGSTLAGFSKSGGVLIENACEWTGGAAGQVIRNLSGYWLRGNTTYEFPMGGINLPTWFAPPSGITACGSHYDGSAFALGINTTTAGYNPPIANQAEQFTGCSLRGCDILPTPGTLLKIGGVCQLTDCGIAASGYGTYLSLSAVKITSGRHSYVFAAAAAVVAVLSGAIASVISVNFVTPSAGDDLVAAVDGATIYEANVQGVAGAAGKLAFRVANSRLVYEAASTATGGTVGTDVAIDGGVGFAIALMPTYLNVQGKTAVFVPSTDGTATIGAITTNKLSGKCTMAAGAASVVITNSLADVGDICLVEPLAIDTTAIQHKAVVTKNTITITTNAGAPNANWSLSWVLVKVCV